MDRKMLVLGALLVSLSLGLTACGAGGGTLLFSNLSLSPGESGTVKLMAAAMSGLSSLQVGPEGAITFDPSVINVVGVVGANGFTVFASDVDNVKGTLTLAAGSTQGPVSNGPLLEIRVKALGVAGASTSIDVTRFDFLLKSNGDPFGNVKVTPGRVSISAT